MPGISSMPKAIGKALEPERPYVETIDVIKLCRNPKRAFCSVWLYPDWDRRNKIEWIRLGEASLRPSRDNADGRWTLDARMAGGVTDFEHDTAYVIKLPLIGVGFDGLAIHYTRIHLIGWVDPNELEDFRVPPPGYDPVKDPGTYSCKDKRCLEEHPKGHPIIPEGMWLPKPNEELFRRVAGKRVEIIMGPVVKDD